jgi:hypothetical protein
MVDKNEGVMINLINENLLTKENIPETALNYKDLAE